MELVNVFERPQIGVHKRFSVAAATRVGGREAVSACVDRVDEPLIVGLPKREVPPPRLDT